MKMRDDSEPLKLGDYVVVVDTRDEWEDLIGILDGFRDAFGEPVPQGSVRAKFGHIRFPVSRESLREARLDSVNEYTKFVVYELKQNNYHQDILLQNLEWFDQDDL